MNCKIFAATALAIVAALPALSATPYVKPVKPINYNNPINPYTMCADPTAIEYEGRIYVYGTNDQQEYESVEPGTNNSYGHIKSLVVMSSADMVNWTHHGVIDMKEVCGSWMWASWAPTIASRVEEDGLTHFYMYFSNSGGGVGVITSTSPVGPWKAPLNRSLITGSTPGLGPCSCPFDPGVVIDDEGNGWLAFGGGDPVSGATKFQPGNARIVKLGPDMISLASDIVPIDAPYHFEANELNIIGGKFVYSYCTGWSDRNDWKNYSTTEPAPSTCSICYMVSDNPLDRNSWQWGGEMLKNPGNFGYPWGNNHSHLHKFNGKYYMFYHTQTMEKLAGIGGGYRSLAVNLATVDEKNVTISQIKMNDAGAPQLRDTRLNALELQQAETMYNAAGIALNQLKSPGKACIYPLEVGAWVGVRKASFGDVPVTRFTAKIKGHGRLEIRIDDLDSEPVAELEFSSGTAKNQSVDIPDGITGNHHIFFVFAEYDGATRFDEWQFSADSSGIAEAEITPELVSEQYLTPSGLVVPKSTGGLLIRRSIYSDGSQRVEKIIR